MTQYYYLRYACPICGSVLVALGYLGAFFHYLFPFEIGSFIAGDEEFYPAAFLFYLCFYGCPFTLGVALPCLANLWVPKAKPFAVTGLALAGITFVLFVLSISYAYLIIPASTLSWEEHWWVREGISKYCYYARIFTLLLSLLCLALACLFHRNNVFGVVALPFVLLFGVFLLTTKIFMISGDPSFWHIWFVTPIHFLVVLLCSVATIIDEKQRQRGSSFD